MKKRQSLEKTIVISIEKSMWQALRKIAFEREISMAELTRMGIDKIVHRYEKKVDVKY